jgi:KUP system potassium uptake protein
MANIETIVADKAPSHVRTGAFWTLTIGAIGVVYGDIGTSPLYAFREAFKAAKVMGWRAMLQCWACCR